MVALFSTAGMVSIQVYDFVLWTVLKGLFHATSPCVNVIRMCAAMIDVLRAACVFIEIDYTPILLITLLRRSMLCAMGTIL